MKSIINTLARITIALLFISSALLKIQGTEQPLIPIGISAETELLFNITVFIEATGGLLLLFGYKMKYIAFGLLGYLAILITVFQLPQIIRAVNTANAVLPTILTQLVVISVLGVLLANGMGKSFHLPLTSEVDNIPTYHAKL